MYKNVFYLILPIFCGGLVACSGELFTLASFRELSDILLQVIASCSNKSLKSFLARKLKTNKANT